MWVIGYLLKQPLMNSGLNFGPIQDVCSREIDFLFHVSKENQQGLQNPWKLKDSHLFECQEFIVECWIWELLLDDCQSLTLDLKLEFFFSIFKFIELHLSLIHS